MRNYKEAIYHAIVSREDYKVIVEGTERKKLRRIARKKYSKEYREEGSMIIVSGENKRDAIKKYEASLIQREEKKISKKKESGRKVKGEKKVKAKKEKKAASYVKPSLEALQKEETRKAAKLSRKNAESDTIFD
ncbi:MAG: hypothetical protein WC102_04835 [Saccharofermentanales bacterium]